MRKWTAIILAGSLMLLATALGVAQDSPEADQGSRVTKRAILQVQNLTCGACFSTINAALQPMAGFSGMGANLLRGLVAVDFTAPLTSGAIEDAISRLGYPATLDAVEEVEEKETFAHIQSKRRGFGGGCCGGSAAAAQCPGNRGSGQARDI